MSSTMQEQEPAQILLDTKPPAYPSIPVTTPASFASMIALSKLSASTFVNASPVIAGGARLLGGQAGFQMVAYGGQVVAQAAWAAAQTVGSEWVMHVSVEESAVQSFLCHADNPSSSALHCTTANQPASHQS